MTFGGSGAKGELQRDELTSASVSISPVPVEELDGEGSSKPPQSKVPPPPRTESSPAKPRARRKPRPSGVVSKYLFGSERYVGEWRRHWIHVVLWATLGILSPFIVGYLIGVLGQTNPTAVVVILVGWVLALLLIGWQVFDWWHERFVLTDKRVMLIGGLITRRVAMMPLARVTDMAYVQSPMGMALNYGTFIIESAGQDQALREIKPLPNPNALYLLFCQEMYDPDAGQAGDA
ncbi:MAG: PH domain-containing protein [Corynebacteriales bacterium]|nr:PH domain-containing protein [Mycobacteriales bacterium]